MAVFISAITTSPDFKIVVVIVDILRWIQPCAYCYRWLVVMLILKQNTAIIYHVHRGTKIQSQMRLKDTKWYQYLSVVLEPYAIAWSNNKIDNSSR